MRNAKAEEIIANAHKVEMDALYRKAEAAKQEFLAAEEEVALETKKIALAKEQGLAAEDLAASLADKKAATAAKQAALETALANLDKATKQAKKDMADNALIYGNGLYTALYDATKGVYTLYAKAQKAVIEKEAAVAKAEVELADAKLNPETDETTPVVIAAAIVEKETDLKAAEKALADAKSVGTDVEAYAKKCDEIDTKLESLKVKKAAIQAKKDIESAKGTDADAALIADLADQISSITKQEGSLGAEKTAYNTYLTTIATESITGGLTEANVEKIFNSLQKKVDDAKVAVEKLKNGSWTSVDKAEDKLEKAKIELEEAKAQAAQLKAVYDATVAAYK